MEVNAKLVRLIHEKVPCICFFVTDAAFVDIVAGRLPQESFQVQLQRKLLTCRCSLRSHVVEHFSRATFSVAHAQHACGTGLGVTAAFATAARSYLRDRGRGRFRGRRAGQSDMDKSTRS